MADCRQNIVSKLCNKDEGLAVVFETVATIYKHNPSNSNDETDGQAPDENWEMFGYGIPSILATESELTLTISDFDQDLPEHEITITSTTQLVQISEYFTVIGVHDVTYFGLCFSDEAVAKKITSLISLVVSNFPNTETGSGNAAKRMKLSSSSIEGESDPNGDNDWVMIDKEDSDVDATTNDVDGTEDVDSPGIFRRNTLRRKSRSRSHSPLTISTPSNFLHVSHVSEDSPVSELTKSMATNVGEGVSVLRQRQRSQAHRESGTESTLSFSGVYEAGSEGSAVPPPPPPPVAPPPPPPPPTRDALLKKMGARPLPGMSLQDELRKGVTLKSKSPSSSSSSIANSITEELKRGIVLRPVGSSSRTLPKPPSRKNSGQLLLEINTFKRHTLRHVETKNMTDYQTEDPNCLQSVLRASLEKMRSRLNMRNFSRVAAVNGEGVEDGFEEDYDGTLIA